MNEHAEWRHWSTHAAKRECIKHRHSAKYEFTLIFAQDSGFRADFDQGCEPISVQRGIDQMQQSS
jgi:hypothetical protein